MSVSIIPESAPFNEEQRAWLNGFLAGWAGLSDEGLATGAALLTDGTSDLAEEEEEFPWHDSSLELNDRLSLAEGKPVKRRLMAAMAQLDCGACGYLCQTYSEAIAEGAEKNLTLCSPGGKETAKMLKKLIKEEGVSSNGQASSKSPSDEVANGYDRKKPYQAVVLASNNLNHEGSSKHTSHVEIDLGESGLTYNVGDSLGVYPTNCTELVNEIASYLLEVDSSSKEALISKYCLRVANDELIEKLASLEPEKETKAKLHGLIDSDELDNMDVLDVLRLSSNNSLQASELIECLNEMTPRLYSIASSLAAHPNQVHLTIGRATYKTETRLYKGVASTMFSDRTSEGDKVRVYAHASHGFTVPTDSNAPMIMVGPGTGIAPFRAFLEERYAAKSKGKNWLLFGDQHAATDFLYEEQLNQYAEEGYLHKISTAFSRDQEAKIYVQDRMLEEGETLFAWLEEGGYFFVCGDAKRMAVDVDKALHHLIAEHGGKEAADSESYAKEYVAKLKNENRYVRDVY